MSVQLKLLDHFKLISHLSINFACDYSEDHRFFILNDAGLYILSFTGSVSTELPQFLCNKCHIQVSDYNPCSHVDIDINHFHSNLSKDDLYEIIMKVEYSANFKQTKPIDPVPIYAKWSPRGLAEYTDCFLGILTNMHSLEIYMKYLNDTEEINYSIICNLTEAIIQTEKLRWSNANRFSVAMKLEEYKKRINSVTPTAFSWSHLLKTNECVVFVGHINGHITVWRLKARRFNEGVQTEPFFLGRYHTQLKRITHMYWSKSSDVGGGLFFADIDGKVSVVNVMDLNGSAAVFNKEQCFLNEPDKIAVEKISAFEYNNLIYILVVKQRVLIIFGINKLGEIFDSLSVYIPDYYITGIHHFGNKIIVLSLPGILTELTVQTENGKINVQKTPVTLKYDMEKYRTHGCLFSKNMVLFFVLGYPWDMQTFSKSKAYINVFVYQNTALKPFDLLWKNDSGSIRDHWDCFEALRINCIKEKRFPWLGLPTNINYDTLPLTKLKTLRWIARLSEMVFPMVPTVKSYEMKPFILLHYLVGIKIVVERMVQLINENSKKKLTDFQMRSLYVQNVFLKEMVAKNILPKANVGKTFIDDIKSVMEVANELEYPDPLVCLWCGEKIMGPLCFPPHADSRCCISMMPMFIIPDYKCFYCKSLVHKSLEEEYSIIFCPYCDIPMDQIHISNEQIIEKCKNFQLELSREKKSDCFKDCLQEDISYSDIEDNTTEYVMFSESDTDDGESISLSKLYEEFSNTKISEETSEPIIIL